MIQKGVKVDLGTPENKKDYIAIMKKTDGKESEFYPIIIKGQSNEVSAKSVAGAAANAFEEDDDMNHEVVGVYSVKDCGIVQV